MGGIATIFRFVLGLGLIATVAGAGMSPTIGGLGAQALPAEESPLGGFPGLGRTYHHVSGRTAAQIRASLNRLELVDEVSGRRIDAYTEWHLSWWIPEEPDGECRIDQAEVLLDVTVSIPRLVNTRVVPVDVLERWKEFIAALEAHEATHVRNAYRARSAMLRAIRQADCAGANQAAEEVMDSLRRRDAEYDRRTRHGMSEGVRFP